MSGDADVINTTLQLVLPCIDDVKILASVTGERISLTSDAPTMGEIEPMLGPALWSSLFVRKDTPRGFLYRPARDMISVDRFSVRPLRALMESRDEDVLDEYYADYCIFYNYLAFIESFFGIAISFIILFLCIIVCIVAEIEGNKNKEKWADKNGQMMIIFLLFFLIVNLSFHQQMMRRELNLLKRELNLL